MKRSPVATLASLVLGLALLAGGLLLVSGPGARFGAWDFGTGFQLLRWAAWLGLASAVVAAAALLAPVLRRERPRSLGLALLIGLVAGAVPLYWQHQASNSPPIHDVGTDLENPPAFVDVVPLRADAPNELAHGGPGVAEAQRQAYPDIVPLVLPIPPGEAFERAQAVAERLGWTIVSKDAGAGRIEATDTTFWFGFEDDVVLRIRPAAGGSRVDARSVSRVGRGDAGTNARRIREFLAGMKG